MDIEKELRELRKEVNRLSQRQRETVKILQASVSGVLTVRQASLLGYYSEDNLYRAIAEGRLLAYRPSPNRLLIDWADFCRFLKVNPTIQEVPESDFKMSVRPYFGRPIITDLINDVGRTKGDIRRAEENGSSRQS